MDLMDDDDDDILLASCSMEVPISTTTSTVGPVLCKPTKKQISWITSSFDDMGSSVVPRNKPSRPKGTQDAQVQGQKTIKKPSILFPRKRKFHPNNNDELWADKHKPKSQEELAVHKKKVGELQDYLEHYYRHLHGKAAVLLLTGPSGVGKTATVHVLASQMGIEVHEWINPTTDVFDSTERDSGYTRIGGFSYQSQSTLFQDFLLRANRYPSLQIFNQNKLHRKMILVEDFPNIFFKNTSQFHDILRVYQQKAHCPLVFIISDSAGGESNERLLFPKNIQEELNVANISFNPVAPTSLVKVLRRIAGSEADKPGGSLTPPDKVVIETLAASCAGDIRAAINALQFTHLKDVRDLVENAQCHTERTKSRRSATRVKKQTSQTDHAPIGFKDTSLFLFRALGKIFYCKRNAATGTVDPDLPPHLQHWRRDPLLVVPEEVIERSQLPGDLFIAYLHQNYTEFYTSLDDIVLVADYFSDADYLTTEWASRSILVDYAALVAARSVMVCNSARATSTACATSSLGWKPLHKPQLYDVNRKIRTNKENAQALFRAENCTPVELHTTLLPYFHLVKPSLRKIGQKAYIQEMGVFARVNSNRNGTESLQEKDIVILHPEEEHTSGMYSVDSIQAPEEENLVIEDFDN